MGIKVEQFSGEKTVSIVCPKCQGRVFNTTSIFTSMSRPLENKLTIHCVRCGYILRLMFMGNDGAFKLHNHEDLPF